MRIKLHILLIVISSPISISVCQEIPIIDLAKAVENPVVITTSDFVQTISYVPLETSADCLVGDNPNIYVTKDYILTYTSEKCLLFDKRNGAFIREIGHHGKDPEGYRYTSGFFNESSSIFYFLGWKGNLIKYSLDGEYRGSVKIPNHVSDFEAPSTPDAYSFINDSILVCNLMIFFGTETNSIMMFNEGEKITCTIPNSHILKEKQRFILRTKEIRFHRFNNDLYYQSLYSDTAFKLSDNEIVPSFILSRGKYLPPFESRWWSGTKLMKNSFISLPVYLENSRFVSFNFYFEKNLHFGLFDKSLFKLKVSKNMGGILNTTDGFIDLSFISINESGELSGLIQPHEILEWIEQNPQKFKSLKLDLQKLKIVKQEDNPVVVIAKYKK